MLSREETERLAAAIHALRADWPIQSLCTFIWERRTRPLLDLSIELVWVALLPDTKTPARIDADGPWKQHVRAVDPVNTTAVLRSIDFEHDCATCWGAEEDHPIPGDDHEYLSPTDHARQLTRRNA